MICLRKDLAKVCFLMRLPLEGQVYLLAALKLTCKAVGQQALAATGGEEMQKFKSLWSELRTLLETQRDKEDGSPRSTDTHSQVTKIIPGDTTDKILATTQLETWDDINAMLECTRNFDPKGAIVLGPAIENLSSNRLGENEASLRVAYGEAFRAAGQASLDVAKGTACVFLPALLGVTLPLTVTAVGIGTGVLAAVGMVSATLFGGAGLFFLTGCWFKNVAHKVFERTPKEKMKSKEILDILISAQKVLSDGRPDAGEQFIKILSQDLGLRESGFFKEGEKILHFPSPRFAFENVLIDGIKDTIQFLTVEHQISATGVLDLLVNVAEVIASRQIRYVAGGILISRDAAHTAARIIMRDLLEESGGLSTERKEASMGFEMKDNPRGHLLVRSREEDKKALLAARCESITKTGKVTLQAHTRLQDVKSFLRNNRFSWWRRGVYVHDEIGVSLQSVVHENVDVGMIVHSGVKIFEGDDGPDNMNVDSVENICESLESEDRNVEAVKLFLKKGPYQHVSEFLRMQFGMSIQLDMGLGPRERELIKLREILKINIAIVFLMDSSGDERQDKTPGEIVAEWLLKEVIEENKQHGFADERISQRIEALKDFYLVFVGKPLALER
jgi:hypothetical protein